MTTVREVSDLGEPLFRIGRLPDPLAWPPWEFVGSGRFDDPQRAFRTLYAATHPLACFVEALAGFRPSLHVLERLDQVWGTEEPRPQGVVPADWYRKRGIAQFFLKPAQPVLDLRSLETREALRAELTTAIEGAGLTDLDVSGVCGPARTLTQAIARWAYERGFEGILYHSRLDSDLTCVALFEGAEIAPTGLAEPISPDNPNFRIVAHLFKLVL